MYLLLRTNSAVGLHVVGCKVIIISVSVDIFLVTKLCLHDVSCEMKLRNTMSGFM